MRKREKREKADASPLEREGGVQCVRQQDGERESIYIYIEREATRER